MELVIFLGSDKETWGQITAIINRGEWEKIILIQNNNASGFPIPAGSEIINIDSSKSLIELKDEMQSKLKKALVGEFEVALSIASGTGKEHMALLAALLNVPVGIKLVVFTKKGIEFIS